MPRSQILSVCLMVLLITVAVGCAKQAEEPAPAPAPTETARMPEPAAESKAEAVLSGRGDGSPSGTLTFNQGDSGTVTIHASIENAPPGEHGLHIHEVGDCSSEDFKSAGGHFNPGDVPHAGPMDAERHGGDLGNITIGEDGTGHLELTSDIITLAEGEPNSVIGRGVILHAKADDLVSQPTGAAGGRIACGVITG